MNALTKQGTQSAAHKAPVITSRIGDRVIQWDAATLSEVLSQLRHERERHQREIETIQNEAAHNALLTEADQIKRETETSIQHGDTRT